MISAPDITFKDGLIRIQSKTPDSKSVSSFTFDFSPSVGRITKILPLNRYDHLTSLSLVGHGFSDVSGLNNLSKLKRLNLSYNSITDFSPLTKLAELETLNLSHNKISSFPKSISNLAKIQSFNISFNRISDISNLEFLQNTGLNNFSIQGNPIMNDEKSFSLILYTLPQLSILNQQRIQREQKLLATQHYSSSSQFVTTKANEGDYVETTPYKILMNESQNRQINMLNKIRDSTEENSRLKSDIDFLKSEVALSKTIGFRKEDPDELLALKLKVKKIKQKLLTARTEKAKAEEELELEKTLLLKQRQMYNRLNERYQNERRSKEPKQVIKSSPKSIPKSAELRLPIVLGENKKLHQTIESMKETEAFHIQEISSQRKQIDQLIAQQNELLHSQSKINATPMNTITTDTLPSTTIPIKNDLERDSVIKELNSKIEELQEENTKKNQEILRQSSTIYKLQEQNTLSSSQFQINYNNQIDTLKLQLSQKDELLQKLNSEKQSYILEIENLKMQNTVLDTTKNELTKQLENSHKKIAQYEKEKLTQAGDLNKIQDYAERIVQLNETSADQKNKLKQQISEIKMKLAREEEKVHQLQNENEKLSQQVKSLKTEMNQVVEASEKRTSQLQKEKEDFVAKISMEIRARDEKIQSLTKLFKDSFNLDTISIENLTSSGYNQKIIPNSDEKDVKIVEYERIINDFRQKLDIYVQKSSELEKDNYSLAQKLINLQKDQQNSENQAQIIIEKLETKIRKQKKKLGKLEKIGSVSNLESTENAQKEANMKQMLVDRDIKIGELSNKLSVQTKESDAKISLLNESHQKLQNQITEIQQLQFSLLTHIQNIMNQFDSAYKFNISDINQATLIQISQFFMNLQVEYSNMKEMYEKAKQKIHDQKSEILEKEESFHSQMKQIEKLNNEKSEVEMKYKSIIEENSQLKINIQESQSQVHDLSLQLSQLENSSEISSIHETFHPEEIQRLKKTKRLIKKEKLTLEQQIKSLNKTIFEKSAEIDQLRSNLQNSELYRSEISSSIETIEQRNQVKISSLQKEIAETESLLVASKSREDIANNEINRLSKENTTLIEQLKKAHKKLENKKFLNKQLEMTISQQKEVSLSMSVQKDQRNNQNNDLIQELKEKLSQTTHQVDAQKLLHVNEKQELEASYQTAQLNIQRMMKKINRLTNLVQEYESESKNANDSILSLKSEIKELKETIKEKDVAVIRATEIRDTTEHLFKALTNKYNDLKNEYEQYKISVDSKEEQTILMKQISQMKKENKTLNKELAQLQRHEKTFNEVHGEQSAKIVQLENQITEMMEQKKNSDLLIEKYSAKINETQKTIQILQSQVDESSHLTSTLTNKIIETKESMIERSQYEELQEKLENVISDKKIIKGKFKESIEEIEKLKKVIEINQNEISSTKEKMAENQTNFEKQIKDLQEINAQKQNEVENGESQQKEFKLEIRKLKKHIQELSKETEDKNMQVSKVSEKFSNHYQKQINKIAVLKEMIQKIQAKSSEQETEIEELHNSIKKAEEQINHLEQEKQQILTDYENDKDDLTNKIEQLTRDISKLRKQIRETNEENERLISLNNDKDNSIHDLKLKLDKSVPFDNFNELRLKYETNKKLLKFNEGKLQTASFDKTLQYEEMKKDIENKEENFNQQVRELNKELTENKDLVRKLRQQIQSLNKKVSILSNPDAEMVPAEELKLAEEKLVNKEKEIEQLINEKTDLISENESLSQKVNELQSSNVSLENQLEDCSHKCTKISSENLELMEINSGLTESIKAVHNAFINNRILHSQNCTEQLNSLFTTAKLNSLSFYEPELHLHSFSICQVKSLIPEKIERQKALIRDIKTVLTSFPIESNFSTTYEIEDELKQIAEYINSLKHAFDDQVSHIDEVNSILTSQHRTIMTISQENKNKSVTSSEKSSTILQESQGMSEVTQTVNMGIQNDLD
ncbi:hypothetical protein TRFO_29092 [Tritrichomonas foetus]|uniref:Leucine Rich Repeat family protein n=1 Tax=Tritrichomonas foetus TaxID=1144522 RepID=A0A1J4JXX8_9EUKA|nr:hypothetical protein TRFO_29092 [Tritrichomonas foetus]|eukprot:OHT03538.1 hypothetical protein TRFO_29092 [Tritrichomonas foetus]